MAHYTIKTIFTKNINVVLQESKKWQNNKMMLAQARNIYLKHTRSLAKQNN